MVIDYVRYDRLQPMIADYGWLKSSRFWAIPSAAPLVIKSNTCLRCLVHFFEVPLFPVSKKKEVIY